MEVTFKFGVIYMKKGKRFTFKKPFMKRSASKAIDKTSVTDQQSQVPSKSKKGKKEKTYHGRVSVKLTLIISHFLIALIPILLITVLLFINAKVSLTEEVTNANMALSDQVTKLMDLKLSEIDATSILLISDQDVLEVISKSEEDYENLYYMLKDRDDNLFSLIQSLKSSTRDLKVVNFINDNEVIDPDKSGVFAEEGFVDTFFQSEEFTIAAEAKARPVWFYGLYGTQDLYFMRSVRNIYSAKANTVLLMSLDHEYLSEDLNAEELGEGARMSLVDSQGKVIASSDETVTMGFEIAGAGPLLENIQASVDASEDKVPKARGNFISDEGGAMESLVIFQELSNGWYYVAEIPTKSILGGIETIRGLALGLGSVATIAALAIGFLLAMSISKPIDYIKGRMRQVEQGDLTVRSTMKGKNELAQLSTSFNKMTENMAQLIEETGEISNEVSADAIELQKIAGQSALASKEVIQAVESLTEGATEQATDADKAAGIVKDLVDQMNKTEESFKAVVDVTNRTKKASVEAAGTIDELSNATTESIELSDNIKTDMAQLTERFKEILGIIDMINAISSQTNLLALNAAIEAARAGDAGKGFAVVADEVRKLASQSSEAAQSISDIVNNIYKETQKTEVMIENGSVIYERQEKAAKNTEQTFKVIVEDMDNIIKEVDTVYELLSGLDAIQNDATDSITSIAAIAQQSASAIEEVLATGEEQTASADHLSEMAESLSKIIDTLSENVKQFKVN